MSHAEMKHFNPHPRQYFHSRFTDEKWQEIYAARERLRVYQEKIQPYPSDLEEEVEPPFPPAEWSRRQWDIIQQLRAEVRGWRKKHAETMTALDKLQKDNAPF